MRKALIAGNWKMYKTPEESVQFVREFLQQLTPRSEREVLICPPATSLGVLKPLLEKSPVHLGAQNVSPEDEGAFTGEISARMLKASGAEYVICGHSERRNIFGETDELVNRKVKQTLKYGLKPILCVGEKLEEREAGKTWTVIQKQLSAGLTGITREQAAEVVIAYEPVWAIGTGKNATPQVAEEVHQSIRNFLEERFGREIAETATILYGGSVKPENIDELMAEADIDGVLVGTASLTVPSFLRIVNYQSKSQAGR
ncbi:MAG TPA: triose-phosphate isomerase [bacterium]|nr:triose-phosphate isomerase [bacterium]